MIFGFESPTRHQPPEGAKLKPVECPQCGENDRTKFYVNKRGYKSNKLCRECHKKQCMVRWHARTPVEKQATRVKAMYGLEPEQYKEMHKVQQGKCAICNEEPKTKRGLHVDHDHETGKVRGLLCHGCNVALGSFKEDVTLLNKAIEYLRSK
jgi:hypothetical protein